MPTDQARWEPSRRQARWSFLTAQAACAPLPQAAAPACLPACVVRCGPEEAAATLRVRLQRDLLAERIVAALARPGMVAAMAACTNAEHAVGLPATHALLAIDGADGVEGRLLSVAAAQLAPTCLLAVLAAAGSCASGETMRLNCQNMGSCMLKAAAAVAAAAAAVMAALTAQCSRPEHPATAMTAQATLSAKSCKRWQPQPAAVCGQVPLPAPCQGSGARPPQPPCH